MEIFNEMSSLLLSICMFAFTDNLEDVDLKYAFSKTYLGLFIFNILANLVIITLSTVNNLIKSIKLFAKKRRQRQTSIQMKPELKIERSNLTVIQEEDLGPNIATDNGNEDDKDMVGFNTSRQLIEQSNNSMTRPNLNKNQSNDSYGSHNASITNANFRISIQNVDSISPIINQKISRPHLGPTKKNFSSQDLGMAQKFIAIQNLNMRRQSVQNLNFLSPALMANKQRNNFVLSNSGLNESLEQSSHQISNKSKFFKRNNAQTIEDEVDSNDDDYDNYEDNILQLRKHF
ncbi:UNKNOWN [Stylonychia lemnae]|uniref:Uncharacterized protein n=1 Tax=Stylonychia lemnae TaxID=5949 RepID=A0A078A2W6_STYLE|nr:UNKNOWN [Stylonychia lemnae]|eukprot:CDW75828.1 UNKNOWN [Stylonychia lemnae]